MSPSLLTLRDLRAAAAERLSRMAYDYYESGADEERTLRDNERAWQRIRLRYRCLVDVARRDLATTVLGRRVALPVLVAPTAFQCLAHPEGERATARAAAAAGTVMTLSTLANTTLEDVATEHERARATAGREDEGGRWFQLYVYKDRGVTRTLVERAEAAGYDALVLTVDAPFFGRRLRDIRNGFALPDGLSCANLDAAGMGAVREAAGNSGLSTYIAAMLDQSLTWRDLEWLCALTRLPVLVKGVVRGDDAARAVDHGARGIIVSNHGGRQLDTSVATASALPEVVDAVGDRAEVLVDGGVRRGTDVLKAVALGARAALVGRPVLWGLAAGGEEGVARALAILREELDLAMALAGVAAVRELTGDLVASA
jgi:4-hydroxymandelate oxidase